MSLFNQKRLYISLLATALLMGCASTDPYKPQSDKDFVYDPAKSFAMNVIDGSLGFHNGLTDANRPKDADTTPGAGSYAADAIIGFGNGGGLGGAFLSMLGTNQGNEPLHTYYGIVYYPVTERGNVQAVFDKIDQELISEAQTKRNLVFKMKTVESGSVKLTFSGENCKIDRELMNLSPDTTCSFIHHGIPKLLKYATVNPQGESGLFAVIGYEKFYLGRGLSLDLDGKYYVFSPVIRNRTKFPYVSNSQTIYPFIKPSKSSETTTLSIEQLMNIDPWVRKHYGSAQ